MFSELMVGLYGHPGAWCGSDRNEVSNMIL